jgi:hypothetical protein
VSVEKERIACHSFPNILSALFAAVAVIGVRRVTGNRQLDD